MQIHSGSSLTCADKSMGATLEEIGILLNIMGVWVNHQCEAEEVSPDDIADGFNLLLSITERTLLMLRSRIQ